MYPLLATGLSAVAGSLLETYHRAADRKAAAKATGAAEFQQLLQQANTTPGGSAKLARQVRLEQLRTALRESPEISTALQTADPAHPPELAVSPEGQVTLTKPDGRLIPLQLSPETQELARQVAALSATPRI